MESGDFLELRGEDVYFVVVCEDEENLVLLKECAVDDVFVLPLDRDAVEKEPVFIVGHQGLNGYERWLPDSSTHKCGICKQSALHYYY